MSMIKCDGCDAIIDSDADPDCFVEVPWLNLEDRVWCLFCREAEFDEHDAESFYAERLVGHADR